MAETVPHTKPSREELHQKLDFILDRGAHGMADRIFEFFERLIERPSGAPKAFKPGPRRPRHSSS